MNEKKTGLENFVERHQADFDAFEPRPDLWDDIEQKLAAPTAGTAFEQEQEPAAPLRVVKLYPGADEAADTSKTAAPAVRPMWLPRPGIAAAVALLLLGGIGAIWSNEHRSGTWTSSTAPLVLAAPAPEAEENTPYTFSAAPVAAAAESPVARLSQEVHRMEGYYAVQIEERQTELQQLEARSTARATADWQRELADLDSTYRQLKVELYRNPEPAVVLDAMNRNLQIRLDILNQQTRTREQMQEYHAQPQLTADSQPLP